MYKYDCTMLGYYLMDPDTDVCQTEQPQISYSVDFIAEQSSAMGSPNLLDREGTGYKLQTICQCTSRHCCYRILKYRESESRKLMHTCMYVCMYACPCIRTCVYACTHACTHVQACIPNLGRACLGRVQLSPAARV